MRRADKVDLPHDVNVTDVDSAPIMTAEETVERLAGNASQDVTPDAELRERFARSRDAQARGGNAALSAAPAMIPARACTVAQACTRARAAAAMAVKPPR